MQEGTKAIEDEGRQETEGMRKWLYDVGNATEDELFARRSSLSRSPPLQPHPAANSGTATNRKCFSIGDIGEIIHIVDDGETTSSSISNSEDKKRKAL